MFKEKADRAKQFVPFDALKGFREALAAKEHTIMPKAALSEEALEELDYKLRQITPGSILTVIYFQGGEYIKVCGMVSKIDSQKQILTIVNTPIPFGDIYDILSENAGVFCIPGDEKTNTEKHHAL